MKVTEFLERQHRRIEQLFTKLESGRPDADTLRELASDLAGHMAIEQEVLYPAARHWAPELVSECFEEHAIAELALNRLIHTELADPAFSARVKSLKDLVTHHVSEEERELLPLLAERLNDAESAALLRQLKARHAELTPLSYELLLAKAPAKTSADRRAPRRTPSLRPPAH